MKRSILLHIALIFDSLGLIGTITVTAKLIIQDLWHLKLDWDKSILLELDTKWKRYNGATRDTRHIHTSERHTYKAIHSC